MEGSVSGALVTASVVGAGAVVGALVVGLGASVAGAVVPCVGFVSAGFVSSGFVVPPEAAFDSVPGR